jgi:hypothetical protein
LIAASIAYRRLDNQRVAPGRHHQPDTELRRSYPRKTAPLG